MFMRKRRRGDSLSFTAVQAIRTAAGPRQKIVAGWSTPDDPRNMFWCPSVSGAIAHADKMAMNYQKGAVYWRAAIEDGEKRGVVYVPTIGRMMHISMDVAWRTAKKYDRQAESEAKRADGLRRVLAEMGDWTWDGGV